MSPESIQAVSGLGALGFAVIAVWAFATGRVVPGSLHSSALTRVDRLTDAVERLIAAVDRMDGRRDQSVDVAVDRLSRVLRQQGDDIVKRLKP